MDRKNQLGQSSSTPIDVHDPRIDPTNIFSPSSSPTLNEYRRRSSAASTSSGNRLTDRLRDSIFVNKKRQSVDDNEDDDEDDSDNQNFQEQVRRNTKHNSVRFSDIPNDTLDNGQQERLNPVYEDVNQQQPDQTENYPPVQLRRKSTLNRKPSMVRFLTPEEQKNLSKKRRKSVAAFESRFQKGLNDNERRKSIYIDDFGEDDDRIHDNDHEDLPKEEKTYPWDAFKSTPEQMEDSSLSSEWVKIFLKLLKLLFYVLTFMAVIILGSIAKLLFHLMANMTRIDKTLRICNKDFLSSIMDSDDDHGSSYLFRNIFKKNQKTGTSSIDPIKPYFSQLTLQSDERIAWIWMLYFVLIAPDIILFIRSAHTCLCKKYEWPTASYTFMIFLTSSAEVIGISMFVYMVLPSLDIIVGLLITNSLFIVPTICFGWLRIQDPNQNPDSFSQRKNYIMRMAYRIASIIQLCSLFIWPAWIYYNHDNRNNLVKGEDTIHPPHDDANMAWAIPLSCILISLGYWENFIGNVKSDDLENEEDEKGGFVNFLLKIKKDAQGYVQYDPESSSRSKHIESRFVIYLFVSLWKCILYFISMLIIQAWLSVAISNTTNNNNNMSDMINALFIQFNQAFSDHPIKLITKSAFTDDINLAIQSDGSLPIIIGLIQIFSAFLCYQTINFVCKVCIQPFGFALPISLVLPVCVSLADLAGQIPKMTGYECWFADRSPVFQYLFFNVHYNLFDNVGWLECVILATWLASFISQIIITGHIWISSRERLLSTSQLFMVPLYTSSFIDQSLMLNRKVDEVEIKRKRKSRSESTEGNTMIYACATVWHETNDELLQMLKSILLMDKDQCYRKILLERWPSKLDNDYYEFQAHLFVDDAFDIGQYYTNTKNDLDINRYVQNLITVLDKAAQTVHELGSIKVLPPNYYITPYGGRIEWTLPGGNQLIAHLKDKQRIRHRKRWSQVMYMYYLLGYLTYQKQANRKHLLTKNTFILALDGDIDFQPDAVKFLVDRMKSDENLGAACGRVHPVGTGPMAWYQQFEYAISHWLQKATEHVFGCVLCSPGCFSLFRASALCDKNVMKTYTTKPSEAIHYVQYDQGEDRWLCTLMLQQGWKIEYSAASDSFTHCPEGFDEFYVQRRRWTPSTMANIIDLLRSFKRTVRENDDISLLYIIYQAGLMLGTILSPGTIFLMLVGASNTSFGLQNQISFYINFVPIFVFVLVCFMCKNDHQILVAQIFSTFYAMLMLAVLVSTAIQIYEESIFAPSVTFFVGMLSVFIISGLMHPQEILCLLPMFIYLLAIPSMYLLLTLYSVINLNNVSWGTRDNPQPTTTNNNNQQQPSAIKNMPFWDIRQYMTQSSESGSKWNVSCLCCTKTEPDIEQRQSSAVAAAAAAAAAVVKESNDTSLLNDIKLNLSKLTFGMEEIRAKFPTSRINKRRSTLHTLGEKNQDALQPLLDNEDHTDEEDENMEHILMAQIEHEKQLIKQQQEQEKLRKQKEEEEKQEKEWIMNLRHPKWIYNKMLESAKRCSIEKDEANFWKVFIKKYLKPLEKNEAREKMMIMELKQLRNRAFFAFAIINIIFVLFVYLMQLHKDIFSFEMVVSSHQNGTETELKMIDGELREVPVIIEKKVLMDPIGLILIIFFGLIMLIQFVGMILHRLSTLTHLLAFTNLNFNSFSNLKQRSERAATIKNPSLEELRAVMEAKNPKPDNAIYFRMSKHYEDISRQIIKEIEAEAFDQESSINYTSSFSDDDGEDNTNTSPRRNIVPNMSQMSQFQSDPNFLYLKTDEQLHGAGTSSPQEEEPEQPIIGTNHQEQQQQEEEQQEPEQTDNEQAMDKTSNPVTLVNKLFGDIDGNSDHDEHEQQDDEQDDNQSSQTFTLSIDSNDQNQNQNNTDNNSNSIQTTYL